MRVNRPKPSVGGKLGVTLGIVDMIVTGAGGRLGRLFAAAWADRPPAGLRLHWSGRRKGTAIQWDMLSDQVPELPPRAIVLHLAGVARGATASFADNAAMIHALLRGCRASKAHAVLFASSASVYAPGPRPARESDPPAPQTDYGRSKLLAEQALQGLAGPDLPVHVLRIGNVPGADALLGPHAGTGLLILDPVPGREGGPVRSWIGPRELAEVIAELARLQSLDRLAPTTLNIAQDPPLPMAALLQASGLPWAYGPGSDRVVADATLATERLQSLMALPPAQADSLAQQAAWAREVLR